MDVITYPIPDLSHLQLVKGVPAAQVLNVVSHDARISFLIAVYVKARMTLNFEI